MNLRRSAWNLTELHEEKNTITFFDWYLFKNEYRTTKRLAHGTTT